MSVFVAHVLAVVVVVLLISAVARRAARLVGQPRVIGEIVGGMFAVPCLAALVGQEVVESLIPASVARSLNAIGVAGLALYLVGVGHECAAGLRLERFRAVSVVSATSFAVPFLTAVPLGLCLGPLVDPSLRGQAPLVAFLAFLGLAMAVTAVPVLVRIVDDRGLTGTTEAKTAVTAAIGIDAVAWSLLVPVTELGRTGPTSGWMNLVLIGALAGAALALRALLGATWARRAAAPGPRVTATLIGTLGIGAAFLTEAHAATAVFGAVAVGLAVPPGAPWSCFVRSVQGAGRALLPLYFVVSGLNLLHHAIPVSLNWAALALVTVLSASSKITGTWLGAHSARLDVWQRCRLCVLMNTRGLTEIVIIQAGLQAGVISASLYIALLGMAILTTVATGPLLALIDRRAGTTTGGRGKRGYSRMT
jgi:Kef-type K+ transport system membrane component KefB